MPTTCSLAGWSSSLVMRNNGFMASVNIIKEVFLDIKTYLTEERRSGRSFTFVHM